MSRLLGLFAVLALLLSMGAGTAAHATERVCLAGSEVAASVIDQASIAADHAPEPDSGYPHQHSGCHGHHLAAPVAHGASPTPLRQRADVTAAGPARLVPAPPGAQLRPPIA